MFCLITSSKLSQQQFEFSLKAKVMRSNPGYLLKSFLLYTSFFRKYLEFHCFFNKGQDVLQREKFQGIEPPSLLQRRCKIGFHQVQRNDGSTVYFWRWCVQGNIEQVTSRLLSAAFWKIITALKSHMTCYNLNLNSWQN